LRHQGSQGLVGLGLDGLAEHPVDASGREDRRKTRLRMIVPVVNFANTDELNFSIDATTDRAGEPDTRDAVLVVLSIHLKNFQSGLGRNIRFPL
jgi:hypothetical protein